MRNQVLGGQQHTHLSSPEHVQVRKLKKRVKDRVTQENISIGKIYDDELARSQLSQTALAVAPTAEEATFPCVIGLLTGKTRSIYERMFDELTFHANRLNLLFEPERITSDFEKSLIKAVSNKFPSARHSGCYFHFTQCIYRKIQSLGLDISYREDDDVRSTCRQLMALPFLPMEEIEFAFEELMEQSPIVVNPLIEYFKNYWITQVSINMWSVSHLDTRTNNSVEGWHNRFNNRINKHHPNIWHFISVIKVEEVVFQQQLIHIQTGAQKKKKKKTTVMEQRLQTLSSRFENAEIDLKEYLQSLSLLVAKDIKSKK
ncbi:unnamed protein product [Rotaria sordida]|uniref:MULE transposase domain-containing protein n=1 Tax=Rotaria sordida TaxID=392033 RepID=A0A819VQC1_9BILA|nr:unnamed protein product [Rotaria sordida]CAF0913700.1 unnamed protein product [Rotaria sordida]CAF4023962.1 unnamed protein product [Rotaria sordida]CAF4062241.1 unnamed protein product [Rotaria sordida]CAF4112503.1 unnamed protein product [Rotaria sordida]